MHLTTRNVNTCFYEMVQGIHNGTIATVRTTSRNGDTIKIPEPCTITYQRPYERVLFDSNRDANPFFHLFECIWMLAGRNDVNPVAFFASNMRNFSDDGKTFNGAYGYRWRTAKCGTGQTWLATELVDLFLDDGDPVYVDQLDEIINHLKLVPDSRRVVLSMWNVQDDLMKITGVEASKDVCCNLSACFSLSEHSYIAEPNNTTQDTGVRYKKLDMTVFNRSNDLIWGALGANAVHFSFLQEYLACALGVRVGVYHQISNNMHVYVGQDATNNWNPELWLQNAAHAECYPRTCDLPLFVDRQRFDDECVVLVQKFAQEEPNLADLQAALGVLAGKMREPYLREVVLPMCSAFVAHKQRNYSVAQYHLAQVAAPDWKKAGTAWVERRREKWLAKQTTSSQ